MPEKKPLTAGEFANMLDVMEWPDPDFAKDVQDGIDWSNLCTKCYKSRLRADDE